MKAAYPLWVRFFFAARVSADEGTRPQKGYSYCYSYCHDGPAFSVRHDERMKKKARISRVRNAGRGSVAGMDYLPRKAST